MSLSYLNKTGLSLLWNKIKAKFVQKSVISTTKNDVVDTSTSVRYTGREIDPVVSSVDYTQADNGLSTWTAVGMYMKDTINGANLGKCAVNANTDGSMALEMYVHNKGTGTEVNNSLQLKIANDGTRSVSVTDGAIWRSAIGAAASDHTHGSITNAGAITSNTALASGDGIIFADSSDSSKLKRSSISFDGSTASKCLTQKGTWETFASTNTTYSASTGIAISSSNAISTDRNSNWWSATAPQNSSGTATSSWTLGVSNAWATLGKIPLGKAGVYLIMVSVTFANAQYSSLYQAQIKVTATNSASADPISQMLTDTTIVPAISGSTNYRFHLRVQQCYRSTTDNAYLYLWGFAGFSPTSMVLYPRYSMVRLRDA